MQLGYQPLHVLLLLRSDALTIEHLVEVFGEAPSAAVGRCGTQSDRLC
jgi:hypothetical protein